MKTMAAMSAMNMSADAWTAPACQSASMSDLCVIIWDTAVVAVSFLFVSLLEIVSGAVRIILPQMANP